MHEIDPITSRDVITTCDYKACPTIKSNNETNTVIVVKSDENLHAIEAARNYGDDTHFKRLEVRAVGGARQ